jgi:putative type I restriction enzyme specificity protein
MQSSFSALKNNNNKMKNKEQHIFPFLERLLDGAEVEWKKLGEVVELKRGRVLSKTFLQDNKGNYPVYSSQTALNGEIGRISTYDFNQEALTWTTDGANAGTVFYRKGKFSITNVCGLITIDDTNELNYKFLFYWLSVEAQKYVYAGMGNPKLMSNQVAKILIPLPPLSVQEEIVRILDKFTTLEAELEAELDCRKRQYEYYRNQLLSFDMLNKREQRLNNVNIKSLEEIVEIKRGRRLVRKELSGTGRYAVFQNSMTPLGYFDNSNVDGDSTFIISAGAAGEIGYSSVDFWAADDIYYFIPSTMVCSKYLYYFLLTKQSAIKGQVRRASVPRLAKSAFAKIQIPIPSLSEQHRIVSILDKFDTLVTSISEGLPKEIELRRKQYEYYREQLLSFRH